MSDEQLVGTYVTVRVTHLEAGKRIGRIPEDTEQTPLVSFQNGWLQEPGRLNNTVTIFTETGRTVSGTLVDVDPRYTHSFGYRLPALSELRGQIQQWKARL